MDDELVTKSYEEINECIKEQVQVCKGKSFPHFAPSSGVCWKCNRNIYQNYRLGNRISIGERGKSPVTGCPHCNRSYCD